MTTLYIFIFINSYLIKQEYNSACKDALIKQLKTHIKGMEQNEKTIEKLNKKFIELQNE